MTDITKTPAVPAARPLKATPGELRIALVGAGKMAQHHAAAMAQLKGLAGLVAVADPDAKAREAVLQHAPGAKQFATLAELLASGPVDVVHVCTPPATHRALAELALSAGCHVYVEKPFAESARDAGHLLALARERGLHVCAGHQLLFERPALQAAQHLPALGRIVHVESYFSFRTVRGGPGGQMPVRADRQLLDILPHPVYLLLRFLDLAEPGSPELAGLELSRGGTVHALLRRESVTGSLVVTLEGRPVESYLRLVGTNGVIHADFVRGTVQRLFGPGTSTVDKLLGPYRLAWQMASGTTAALGGRLIRRQRSYPGLVELFGAFYRSIQSGAAPPLSPTGILDTVRVCEAVASRIERLSAPGDGGGERPPTSRCVVVTGGTGFFGEAVVRKLVADGMAVRVLSRRGPAPWDRVPGVSYREADLGAPIPGELLEGADLVIHAAAETAGGWEAHQRNSVDATDHVLRASAAAGVRRVIHVSSLAVLGNPPSGVVSESTDLESAARGSGPYVWGKLESERLASRLSSDLGLAVRIVRPGAIVDYERFDPPGRLGRRLGPFFVAVGSPADKLGVVNLQFAAEALVGIARQYNDAPAALNLIEPELPTKRQLVQRLRDGNPDLRVVWLPRLVLIPLSWVATIVQAVLRPGRPRISLHKVFAVQRYDTSLVAAWARTARVRDRVRDRVRGAVETI